jgi:DNA-binding response OmpR family regulator
VERERARPILRVLIVDDSASTRLLVARTLTSHGFVVADAADAGQARDRMARERPDVVVLDIQLPDASGLDLLREIVDTSETPVILLTGQDTEEDCVLGLEYGAEDCVTKPFYPRELAARVRRVAARRPAPSERRAPAPARMAFDRLVIDTVTREVTVDGRLIDLTSRELDLLAHLAATPRKAFSRDELLADVWRSSAERQSKSTVTEHVRRLRQKIEDDPQHPRWLKTVRVGAYRFEP